MSASKYFKVTSGFKQVKRRYGMDYGVMQFLKPSLFVMLVNL